MKKLLFLLLLLLTTVGFAQDNPIEVPKIVVKVSVGETVQFEKVSVKFLKILEDSRCPSDVTCVWEGQAKVLVEIAQTSKETQQVVLLFGKRKDKSLFTSEGYSLKGISLLPYPTSQNIGKMKYTLLVSEEKN